MWAYVFYFSLHPLSFTDLTLRSIAEFATVILAGTFPTLPRLVQYFRSHNKTSNSNRKRSQPYSSRSYPYPAQSKTRGTHRSDLEAGGGAITPWDGEDTANLNESYIPLEDHVGAVDGNGKKYAGRREDIDEEIAKAFDEHGRDRDGVLKTVRMETSFGPRKEVDEEVK